MLYKITDGLVDIPLGQLLILHRDTIHIQPIYARTKYYEFSFFPRTVIAWNSLHINTISAQSLNIFKSKIVNLNHPMPY